MTRTSNDPDFMNMPLESLWGCTDLALVCGPTGWDASGKQFMRRHLVINCSPAENTLETTFILKSHKLWSCKPQSGNCISMRFTYFFVLMRHTREASELKYLNENRRKSLLYFFKVFRIMI